MQDLYHHKLVNLVGSLKGLGDLMGFINGEARIGDNKKPTKVIIVPMTQMQDLLDYRLSEVVEEKNDNNDGGKVSPTPPTKPR